MNLKTAKKLRRICKGFINHQAKNNQEQIASFMETQYSENEANRKMHIEYKTDNEGNFTLNEIGDRIVKESYPVCPGTLTIIPQCFRGMYLRLKKQYDTTPGLLKLG